MNGQWQTVAQGTSLLDLRQTIADMELPKGSLMRIQMDTSLPWVFDMAGAEWAFKPFVPTGMRLIDVWGEGKQGIVEMEADPAWLAAALLFIKTHWLAITISGFVLSMLISAIVVSIRVPETEIPKMWMWAAIAIIGVVAIPRLLPARAPPTQEGT